VLHSRHTQLCMQGIRVQAPPANIARVRKMRFISVCTGETYIESARSCTKPRHAKRGNWGTAGQRLAVHAIVVPIAATNRILERRRRRSDAACLLLQVGMATKCCACYAVDAVAFKVWIVAISQNIATGVPSHATKVANYITRVAVGRKGCPPDRLAAQLCTQVREPQS